MKILKIVRGDDAGGVFACEKQFMRYWKEHGIVVDLIIVGGGDAEKEYKELASNYSKVPGVENITERSWLQKLYYNYKNITRLKNAARTLKTDTDYEAVIYRRSNFIHLAGRIGRQVHSKVYWHLPNSVHSWGQRLYYNFNIRRFGVEPVANSLYTKKTLGKICRHVVYPGYDEARIIQKTEQFKKDLQIPEEALVFGTASRITHTKAQDLLIEGMIQSGLLKENVHLLVSGGPLNTPYAEKCIKLAKGYEKNIHFLGPVQDMSKFYSSIDVYINSRRDAEPFGISVAEAMGAGLPVIAYHLGGPAEMIEGGVNGWLIKEPNYYSYTEEFLRAYQKRNEWEKMGRNSKEKAGQYNSSFNAQKFLDIIIDDSN